MTQLYTKWFDDSGPFGCGYRSYFIMEEGRKWARLVCLGTGETAKVPLAEATRGTTVEELPKSRFKDRLRHMIWFYTTAGLRIPQRLRAFMQDSGVRVPAETQGGTSPRVRAPDEHVG